MSEQSAPATIYRCGWCGYPVTAEGGPLPGIEGNDDATAYLRDHKGAAEQHVQGFCCPSGNEEHPDLGWGR